MSIVSGTVSGVMAANAQNDATQAQKESADKASDIQLQMYNQSREDFAPFLEPSAQAMATLQSELSGQPQTYIDANGNTQTAKYAPTETAGFKYTKSRTLEDLGRSLRMIGRGSGSSAGLAYGRTLGDLNAANEDRYSNKLLNLAKIGQGAAGSTGTLGQNTAGNLSSLAVQQGNISAQQGVNRANLYAGLGNQTSQGLSNAYQGYKVGQSLGWWGGSGAAASGAGAAEGAEAYATYLA